MSDDHLGGSEGREGDDIKLTVIFFSSGYGISSASASSSVSAILLFYHAHIVVIIMPPIVVSAS